MEISEKSHFFGKISQWVRACLPTIEMLWQEFAKIAADIKATLMPVWEWLEAQVNAAGRWLGAFIQGAIPFIRQGWNIVKAICTVAWEFIQAGWNMLVEICMPIINSFIETVKGWFQELGNFLTGEQSTSWESFKNAALTALIVLEFGIRNWQRVAMLAWDMIKLKMLEWIQGLQPIALAFQNFINGVIDGFNAMARGLARTMQGTINGIITAYNAVARRLGRETINTRVTVDARQLDHVSISMANMQDRIAELRQSIAAQQAQLGGEVSQFIQQRLAELTAMSATAETTVRRQNQQQQEPEKAR